MITSNPLHERVSPHVRTCSLGASAVLAAGLAAGLWLPEAQAAGGKKPSPFKVAKVYFETNATACDMGIQIVFDTDGVQTATVSNPSGQPIHVIRASSGLKQIGGQTEGFLESVEPVISDLLASNPECVPDPEEPVISLEELRQVFPAGTYSLAGTGADGARYADKVELTYAIPAGPVLMSPNGDAAVDPDYPVEITWEPVTTTIAGLDPAGGTTPVTIAGYQVLVYDANAGESPQEFNVTVPGSESSVAVPTQFLQPDTDYTYEVLAIEDGGSQTISEGAFSTGPAAR